MEEKKERDKHCNNKQWNAYVYATEIVNVCIMQPHLSALICWIFKVSDINCSNQCVEDLCMHMRGG